MNTIEGNKLIADFMGAVWSETQQGWLYWFDNPPTLHATHQWNDFALQYHSSYDWLMPVVEKIEQYSCLEVHKVYVQINDKSCSIWTYFDVKEILRLTGDDKNEAGKFKVRYSCDTKIWAIWHAVVDFIRWYNNQTPQP